MNPPYNKIRSCDVLSNALSKGYEVVVRFYETWFCAESSRISDAMENQALTSSLVRASPFPSLSSSCCFKASPFHCPQKRVSLRYVKPKHTDLLHTEHMSTKPSYISKAFRRSFQKHDENNPIRGFVEIQCKMRWAVLLLYRALLVGGISFTMASPAIANTNSLSSPPSAYEVVIEKEEGKNSENAEKGEVKPQDLDNISQCETMTHTHAYMQKINIHT